MDDLTGFQRDLFYVVAGLDEPKGITVQRELESAYGSSVIHARVYQNLDTLEGESLVEKGAKDARTNYYDLTEAGEDVIRERREWEREYLAESDVEVEAVTDT
ncbi:helix-turn-helix transcriptional regulator [Halocalculus aciditolerans]|uniref:PadR family transcriptional regulator n=1 Tax=Halocalculus aciditolerans TaxID=1383812 RepID=A0A830FCB6_9EURY|nr:helix-turn-helix transcriptional regulator [Halocalculus aciditolerans]GGL60637.1 PadR family transcriptional regulator [Halocalculus aciditolerans]